MKIIGPEKVDRVSKAQQRQTAERARLAEALLTQIERTDDREYMHKRLDWVMDRWEKRTG